MNKKIHPLSRVGSPLDQGEKIYNIITSGFIGNRPYSKNLCSEDEIDMGLLVEMGISRGSYFEEDYNTSEEDNNNYSEDIE